MNKILRRNHEQNYDDGRRNTEPTTCAMCCCSACTGFQCPWKKEAVYVPDWLKSSARTARCGLCFKNTDFKRIYDCDYYTYHKRRRFYVPRKITRRKNKADIIAEKLDLILKKLDNG